MDILELLDRLELQRYGLDNSEIELFSRQGFRNVDIDNGNEIKLHIDKKRINVSRIKEYNGKELKKYIFRPRTLNEYIGQEQAKELVKVNISKIKNIRPVHFIIDGLKGHGKTSLAYIISNMIGANRYEIIGADVSIDKLTEILNWINSTDGIPVVFIDEIHNLSPDIIEILYPILEDFKIQGKQIKPFVLIGATTEKNMLVKKFSPFVDRFQVQITLSRYTEGDIFKILKQYKDQLYKESLLPDNWLKVIAENCKLTPRIGIALLEDLLVVKNVRKVLDIHNIVYKGLTNKDIQILQILAENDKPIGEEALSMMLGISREDYKFLHEAYLIEMGYMARTRSGRIILDKGKRLLEEIKEVGNG